MKKNNSFRQLLTPSLSESEKFHKKTMFKDLPKTSGDPKFWPEDWKKVYFKGYSRLNQVVLPKPRLDKSPSLLDTLFARKSERNFSKKSLRLTQLSNLLYFSAGLKQNKSPWIADRFYPSAGSRYPLETYAILLKTELPPGVYHYYLKGHSLELLTKIGRFHFNKYFNQKWLGGAAAIILITAVFRRTTGKYNDRGYRHILTEAGHLGQNFCLVAEALNLACCAVGGYSDYEINRLLDINYLDESLIYVLALGNK